MNKRRLKKAWKKLNNEKQLTVKELWAVMVNFNRLMFSYEWKLGYIKPIPVRINPLSSDSVTLYPDLKYKEFTEHLLKTVALSLQVPLEILRGDMSKIRDLEILVGCLGGEVQHLKYSNSVKDEEIQKLRNQNSDLTEIITQVHSWIVCSAISSPEDMMKSADWIEDITNLSENLLYGKGRIE